MSRRDRWVSASPLGGGPLSAAELAQAALELLELIETCDALGPRCRAAVGVQRDRLDGMVRSGQVGASLAALVAAAARAASVELARSGGGEVAAESAAARLEALALRAEHERLSARLRRAV